MLFIKVYGQFPETSEKLAFLASQKKHVHKVLGFVDYHIVMEQ